MVTSKCIGTLLENNTFRIAVALRYGCGICAQHRCGVIVLEDGCHRLSCIGSAGRHAKHADLNNMIHSADIPLIREPPG